MSDDDLPWRCCPSIAIALLVLTPLTACGSEAIGRRTVSPSTEPSRGGPEETSIMTEIAIAQIVLRGAGGGSIRDADGPLTADTIARYRVPEEQVEEARERFQALGFEVEAEGPFGFSVSGERSLFERVFSCELLASEGAAAPESRVYRFGTPPEIPEELSDLVADVTLPSPPELHQ